MSDEKLWEGEPPTRKPTKEIHVTLEGGKAELDRKDAEIKRLEKILSDLAENALAEKKQELTEKFPAYATEIQELGANDINDYELSLYKNEKPTKKKVSTGSVRLIQSPKETNPLFKEFSNAEEMLKFVYSHADNPASKHYGKMNEVKRKLWEKMKSFGTMNVVLDTAPEGLRKNHTYQEYGEWARKQNAQRRQQK